MPLSNLQRDGRCPIFSGTVEEMRGVCYNEKPHYRMNAGVKGRASGFSGAWPLSEGEIKKP
jgi:hypothetical protein